VTASMSLCDRLSSGAGFAPVVVLGAQRVGVRTISPSVCQPAGSLTAGAVNSVPSTSNYPIEGALLGSH
jgi:hypothetical protein